MTNKLMIKSIIQETTHKNSIQLTETLVLWSSLLLKTEIDEMTKTETEKKSVISLFPLFNDLQNISH